MSIQLYKCVVNQDENNKHGSVRSLSVSPCRRVFESYDLV